MDGEFSASDGEQDTPAAGQAMGSADAELAATAPDNPASPDSHFEDNILSPPEPASPPSTRVQAAANELNLAELPETQVSEAKPQVDEEPDKNLVWPVPVLILATTTPEGTAAAELAKT